MSSGTRRSFSVGLTCLTTLALTTVCAGQERYGYKTLDPRKFFGSQPVDSVAFDRIRDYAAALQFDSVIGAADARPIDFATGRVGVGDSAWIQPEKGAWALDSTDLEQGRIIAQIRTKATVYRRLGYTPNRWTWWWVDKRGGRWRSLFFSDSLGTRVQDTLHRAVHRNYEWRQSIARLGTQWGTCDRNSCCSR